MENLENPDALAELLEPLLASCYGASDVARILAGTEGRRRCSLRVNRMKSDPAAVADALERAGQRFEPVPWYEDAFLLEPGSEEAIRELPIFLQGEVYLQSLSAMIPALVLEARAGHDICDLCAAPGGKTTQLVALTQGSAFVTACERSGPRAERLRFNLQRQGAGNVTVMRADARKLDDFFSFDRILLDAPCSGSGTLLAHDPKGFERFSAAFVERSAALQQQLLTKGLSLLRPGGVLVYSTCSVLKRENEEVVRASLQKAAKKGCFEVAALEADGSWPLLPSTIEGALTLCPSECYEGFFVAKIRRTS